jgi:hypothetical protein
VMFIQHTEFFSLLGSEFEEVVGTISKKVCLGKREISCLCCVFNFLLQM